MAEIEAGAPTGELEAAIVREMGGPSFDPDEMTTLGFWLGNVGFSFDSRGPTIEIIECGGHGETRMRRRRIAPRGDHHDGETAGRHSRPCRSDGVRGRLH